MEEKLLRKKMKTEAEGYKLTTLSISDMYAAMALPGIHHDLSCDIRNTGSLPVTCTYSHNSKFSLLQIFLRQNSR